MGWSFEGLRKFIDTEVGCEPFTLLLGCFQCTVDGNYQPCPCPGYHTWWLQARLWRRNSRGGKGWDFGYGGKQLVEHDMDRSTVAKRCFVAVRDYGEHEVREAFQFRGYRVFDPHMALEDLAGLCQWQEMEGKD